MSFKDGRIGVGKTPIFPLDISGSCRIDGDLILGGRFSDAFGEPIQLGSGSGAASTPDQTNVTLPSWSGGTIGTQGLGGLDANNRLMYNNVDNTSATNSNFTTIAIGDEALESLTSGVRNIALGYNALNAVSSGHNNIGIGGWTGFQNTGSQNTFIGHQAAYGNSAGTGSSNVGIGQHAFYKLTNGNDNVAIGHDAAYNLTTGSSNVCIGYNAGQNLSNSGENVFLGSNSGSKLTSGGYHNVSLGYGSCGGGGATATNLQNNVCLGQSAGGNMTAGYENVYLGQYAGLSCTTGAINICIGKEAGKNKTDKSGIIAIGKEALYSNMGGAQCIAIGYQALKGVAGNNHFDNIAIGYQAMRVVTTATNCVVIGYDAGLAITSGGGNVLVGNYCGKSISTGAGNVCIGSNAAMNTNGQQNICIGSSAGQTSTTNYHIAIGYYAGYAATAAGNVCIGQNAGKVITSGAGNVCIGENTGSASLTASHSVYVGMSAGYHAAAQNIGIGFQAMMQNAGANNVAIGYNACKGASLSYSRTANVCIGYGVLQDATSAQYNTVIGYSAGEKVTTGAKNVAIGFKAGGNANFSDNVFIGEQAGWNGGGSSNVAIGKQSKYSGGGSYTVAIGNQALYTGGGDNSIAIGYQSMRQCLSTCPKNICIGYQSGYNITSGAANIVVGHEAYDNSTTGYYNVAIGYEAMHGANVTGHRNVAIGQGAGMNFTSGYRNNMIGYYAGYNISSGYHNQCFGTYAGYWITTGYGCVCLGFSAGPKTATDGAYNNRLYIGNTDTTAARGVDSYIYGEFDGNPLMHKNHRTFVNNKYSGSHSYTRYGPGAVWGYYLYIGAAHTSAQPRWDNGQSCVMCTTGNLHMDCADGATLYLNHYSDRPTNCGGTLHADSYANNSDRRIKENIVDVPDDLALQYVRDIPCRYYEYKDKKKRGFEKTIGFIAQEVKEVFPMAVNDTDIKFIPNEMRNLENISWQEIQDGSDNKFKLSCDLQNVNGVRYKFYYSNETINIYEDNYEVWLPTGNTDNTFTFDSSYNNIFCYGKEVEDFHTIDKAKIFALHHSAIQELDRENQELDRENQELRARLAQIEAFLGI